MAKTVNEYFDEITRNLSQEEQYELAATIALNYGFVLIKHFNWGETIPNPPTTEPPQTAYCKGKEE